MIQLAVVSGKGGTGKTVLTGGIAHCSTRSMVLADCDVDASNLEFILSPRLIDRRNFFGMDAASIDSDLCTACGTCSGVCRFGAVATNGEVFSIRTRMCEGCGVCRLACPAGAVTLRPRVCGEIFYSGTRYGNLVHARLAPGAPNSGLLVAEVRKTAILRNPDSDLMLIDGPPGTGCPLISTVSGTDVVLAVTEPSRSGLHDLERLVRVCRTFRPEIFAVINKWDLDPDISEIIRQYCRSEDIPVIGIIPYDEGVMAAVRNGKPVTASHSPSAEAIQGIWDDLARKLW
ncbi:MAG: ATP-binding protein [Methanoregulaceae archaeon]|jgi:MinD superfamily P-loop ATPase